MMQSSFKSPSFKQMSLWGDILDLYHDIPSQPPKVYVPLIMQSLLLHFQNPQSHNSFNIIQKSEPKVSSETQDKLFPGTPVK